MNLVLLGPPGAGKGTQAKMMKEEFDLDHISSGDLLRSAVKAGSALGKEAKSFMGRGALVPDELVVELIKERVNGKKEGFLLDGFPRNESQAKILKNMLLEMRTEINAALNIDVDDEIVIKRLSSRRTCSKCHTPYNLISKKPKVEGKCDECGGELIQRDDDTIATIRDRLETYKSQTTPLLNFYKREGTLKTVDGNARVDEIFSRIKRILADL